MIKNCDIQKISDELGIKPDSLRLRIKKKGSLEKAISQGKKYSGCAHKPKKIIYKGRYYTIQQLSDKFGVWYSTLYQGIKKHGTVENYLKNKENAGKKNVGKKKGCLLFFERIEGTDYYNTKCDCGRVSKKRYVPSYIHKTCGKLCGTQEKQDDFSMYYEKVFVE